MSAGPKAAAFATFLRVFTTAFEPAADRWVPVVWLVALATMVVGNFAALAQTNPRQVQRFLETPLTTPDVVAAEIRQYLMARAPRLPVLVGEDALFVFLDTDSRPDTGYFGGGLPIGADFMVNITGRDGRITSQKVHSFTGGGDRGLWSWSQGTDMAAATDLTRVEAGVPLGGLGQPAGNIGVFYYMTDWRQKRDTGERISYDMRTQGGRGLAGGGTASLEGSGDLLGPGIVHPPLHAPEFGEILLPLVAMTAVFALARRPRKRRS
jgi:hypothetical protein